MTAQIEDKYLFGDKEYTAVALSDPVGFDPRDYGLKPHFAATACYRGFWCDYSIEEDMLVLKNLYIYNRDGDYPAVNGREVSPQQFTEVKVSRAGVKGSKSIVEIPLYLGHRKYENVDMVIDYTGRMLLASEDGELKEAVFCDGILIQAGEMIKRPGV